MLVPIMSKKIVFKIKREKLVHWFNFFGRLNHKIFFHHTREYIDKFNSIKLLDVETKKRWSEKISYYGSHYAIIKVSEFYISLFISFLLVIIVITPSLFAVNSLIKYFTSINSYYKLSNFLTPSFSYVTFSALTVFTSYISNILRSNTIKYLSIMYSFAAITITIIIICLSIKWDYYFYFALNGIIPALMVNVLLFILTPLLLIFILPTSESIIEKIMDRRYPMIFLVRYLLLLLHDIDNKDDYDSDLQYKQHQLLWIENAARCIGNYFPRQIHSGDIVTDTWMREKAKRYASALREKKKWLLTPKHDTYDYFARNIIITLDCLINDHWDDLEEVEPERLSVPQLQHTIVLFLLRLLRATIVALLPIICIYIFNKAFIAFDRIIEQYLYVGAFIWAFLSFIIALDPNFSIKMSAVKDIADLLWPSRGK